MRKLTLQDMSLCPFFGAGRENNNMGLFTLQGGTLRGQSGSSELSLTEAHRPVVSNTKYFLITVWIKYGDTLLISNYNCRTAFLEKALRLGKQVFSYCVPQGSIHEGNF